MKTLLDIEVPLAENIRLIKRLRKRESEQEYPEIFKWALQLLYFDGSGWVEICRIDNYPHEGQIGAHVHECRKQGVRRVDLTFNEAEMKIIRIGARMLMERFHEEMKR